MNPRLKQIIFKKLYRDLSHVEIIPHNDSIWFISRKDEYWYFQYEKCGNLWWRWSYFNNFFVPFSMEYKEFQWIISDWVEEVLNCKVNTPDYLHGYADWKVEEVLNCKVNTPRHQFGREGKGVEEVLNCKVNTPMLLSLGIRDEVEEVLNCKVKTPRISTVEPASLVEEVLNCKVKTPIAYLGHPRPRVEDVLNSN